MANDPKQTKKWIEVGYDPQTNFKHITIHSSLSHDDEISALWKILGRIADDPTNGVLPSEDAEVFIGFIE